MDIQRSLISIPGHAEYYRNKILSTQEDYKEKRDGPARHEYLTQQRYGFETLRHLPSPESVRVLGEMMSNDWAPPGNETEAISERLPVLSLRSVAALSQLPIRDKPFDQPGTVENRMERVEAWRIWYEQIKDGKRTFRFEGDPTEYDLNGPAPSEKLTRIALDRKRDLERGQRHQRAAGEKQNLATTTVVSKPGNLAIILSSLLVLVSAVWYFFRMRSKLTSPAKDT